MICSKIHQTCSIPMWNPECCNLVSQEDTDFCWNNTCHCHYMTQQFCLSPMCDCDTTDEILRKSLYRKLQHKTTAIATTAATMVAYNGLLPLASIGVSTKFVVGWLTALKSSSKFELRAEPNL